MEDSQSIPDLWFVIHKHDKDSDARLVASTIDQWAAFQYYGEAE